MPPTPTRKATCGTKAGFDSRARAREARITMIQRYGHDSANLGVYCCTFCGKFHIGHRNRDTNQFRHGGTDSRKRRHKR